MIAFRMHNRERQRWLGSGVAGVAVCVALSMLMHSDKMGELGFVALLPVLLLVVLGVTAWGLLTGRKIGARLATGVFVLVAVSGTWSSVQMLGPTLSHSEGPLQWLWLANAVMTNVLFLWLCSCAALVALDCTLATTRITMRVVGTTLVAIAIPHLAAAMDLGVTSIWRVVESGLTARLSSGGVVLTGFLGWPIWHLTLVGVGLILVRGKPWPAANAAQWLAVSIPAVFALLGIAILSTPHVPPTYVRTFLLVCAVLASGASYLSFWFRAELRALAAEADENLEL